MSESRLTHNTTITVGLVIVLLAVAAGAGAHEMQMNNMETEFRYLRNQFASMTDKQAEMNSKLDRLLGAKGLSDIGVTAVP